MRILLWSSCKCAFVWEQLRLKKRPVKPYDACRCNFTPFEAAFNALSSLWITQSNHTCCRQIQTPILMYFINENHISNSFAWNFLWKLKVLARYFFNRIFFCRFKWTFANNSFSLLLLQSVPLLIHQWTQPLSCENSTEWHLFGGRIRNECEWCR